jgi:cytochrome P450
VAAGLRLIGGRARATAGLKENCEGQKEAKGGRIHGFLPSTVIVSPRGCHGALAGGILGGSMPKLSGFAPVPIPGPRAAPLVGTAARFYRFLEDPVGVVLSLRKYGDVVAVVDENPAVVCVFGAALNRDVLSNPAVFRNPEDFFRGPEGSARDKMRSMVVTSNGEKYRRNRRLMMPAFQRSALDGYAAQISALTRDVLNDWVPSGVVAADALCRELSICIAVKCFYGLDVKDGARDLGRAMAEFVSIVTSPLNILLPINLPGLPYHRGVRLGEELAARMMMVGPVVGRAGPAAAVRGNIHELVHRAQY